MSQHQSRVIAMHIRQRHDVVSLVVVLFSSMEKRCRNIGKPSIHRTWMCIHPISHFNQQSEIQSYCVTSRYRVWSVPIWNWLRPVIQSPQKCLLHSWRCCEAVIFTSNDVTITFDFRIHGTHLILVLIMFLFIETSLGASGVKVSRWSVANF